MFKPSKRIALLGIAMFLSAAALPGIALAKQGGRSNTSTSQGGGPPACRDLQGTIDQLQTVINSLTQSVDTIDTNFDALGTRLDTITSTLDTLEQDVADIRTTLETQGISALQASVAVDEAACVSGASQCASTTTASSFNQNPVAITVLVMNGAPVTNLASSNFTLTTDFGPNGVPANLVLCTSGDTGCGSGAFIVNSGSGGYQLWVSPTSNWMPGTYTAQLKVTDTLGHSTIELVQITIPA